MADRPYNVLFLCTGNSARSILAEALIDQWGRGEFRGFSAGSHPKGEVHPIAIQLLQRMNLPTEGLRSKSWDEFAAPGAPPLDFVFTVCDNAAGEVCPYWPGQPMTAHWGVPDPAAVEGTDTEKWVAFRERLSGAGEPHQDLYQSAARLARSHRAAGAPGRDRPVAACRAGMNLPKRLAAEAIGSILLAPAVVGSGVMAERLAGGNMAIALLANTGATVAVLATLIALLGPVSGAHFNPAVSLIQAVRNALSWRDAGAYVLVQVVRLLSGRAPGSCDVRAAVAAGIRAHPHRCFSVAGRSGRDVRLILIVLGHRRAEDAPWMVAAWIGAAYWFTASTSFANPAITIARSLSDTFAGIRPRDVPDFVVAQLLGAFAAYWFAGRLLSRAVPAQPSAERRCAEGAIDVEQGR